MTDCLSEKNKNAYDDFLYQCEPGEDYRQICTNIYVAVPIVQKDHP